MRKQLCKRKGRESAPNERKSKEISEEEIGLEYLPGHKKRPVRPNMKSKAKWNKTK